MMTIAQRTMRRWRGFFLLAVAWGSVLSLTVLVPPLCFGQDITLGAVEDVLLLPWGVKLPARIDTGAATTSLDAHDLVIREDAVTFRLSHQYGGQLIRLPLKNVRHVRSSSGQQQRPVVEMTICLGRRQMQIDVNLTDRSQMTYPLLVGRNVIEQGFIVDVRQTRKLTPDCSDAKAP